MQHGEIIPIKMKMKLFPRIAGYGVDNDGKFTISVRDFTRKALKGKIDWPKLTLNCSKVVNNLPFEYHFKQCEYSKPAISKILDLKPSKAHYSNIWSFKKG